MVWFALVIPVVTTLIVWRLVPHSVAWWEILAPALIALVIIAICAFGTESAMTCDSETHGGWVARATYYEPWNERVSCRHPKYRKNSKGEQVQDGYQHAYDVDDHPARWEAVGSNGECESINADRWEWFTRRFNCKSFRELHRYYHTQDGDAYDALWPGDDDSLVSISTRHSYENRVQCSTSLFNFQEVTPEDVQAYALYDYPGIDNEFFYPAILCRDATSIVQFTGAQRALELANAKLGARKQLRIWLLVFHDQPMSAGVLQRDYWKGGNKNEFVVCVGLQQGKVAWGYTFSWCDDELIKADAKAKIASKVGQTFDALEYSNWLVPELDKRFERKHFADFSYLTVEMPTWMAITTCFLTLLASLGFNYWSAVNEFTVDNPWVK